MVNPTRCRLSENFSHPESPFFSVVFVFGVFATMLLLNKHILHLAANRSRPKEPCSKIGANFAQFAPIPIFKSHNCCTFICNTNRATVAQLLHDDYNHMRTRLYRIPKLFPKSKVLVNYDPL